MNKKPLIHKGKIKMPRHTQRGFLLIIVLVLFSLAVILEVLTTRHLVDLRRHIQHRQQLIQQRLTPATSLTPPTTQPHP